MRLPRPGSSMRRLPVTEAPHPDGLDLERLPASRLVARLHAGDQEAVRAVTRALPAIARLADACASALRAGGRLIYVGAGTSGRLGALDAAECPPTFGQAGTRVRALVAGGVRALTGAVEGAEDDGPAARRAIRAARAGARDVVVGVSASGTTPFVLAALAEARARGAATALVTSNPAARAPGAARVLLATGAERIAGSTRMKAGTAAKMALGLLSTAAFVRLGAVRGGRMIEARPVNEKLRRRAVRTVAALTGLPPPAARAALVRSGWSVRKVLDAASRAGRATPSGRGARRERRAGAPPSPAGQRGPAPAHGRPGSLADPSRRT